MDDVLPQLRERRRLLGLLIPEEDMVFFYEQISSPRIMETRSKVTSTPISDRLERHTE